MAISLYENNPSNKDKNLKKITKTEFQDILSGSRNEKTLVGYDFFNMDLSCLVIQGFTFINCCFSETHVRGSLLIHVDFTNCVFDKSVLFSNSVFKSCFMNGTVFDHAVITLCDFLDCKLYESAVCFDTLTTRFIACEFILSDFSKAENIDNYTFMDSSFDDVRFPEDFYLPTNCPIEGSFIGWKAVNHVDETGTHNSIIAKLLIPNDAIRSSSNSRKCRANKVKVLEFQDIEGNLLPDNIDVYSFHDPNFRYTHNETVNVPDFDTNRYNVCSNGIHFFIDRADAVQYAKNSC